MLFRLSFDRPVADATYLELVRSLSATFANTLLFGLLCTAVVAMMVVDTDDPVVRASGILTGVLAFVRVLWLRRLTRKVADPELTTDQVRREERAFGSVYLAFAATFGLFAGRTFQTDQLEVQLVPVALVVGFAAGVAAGLSLRPWISVPAMVLAVAPLVCVSVLRGGVHHLLLAVVLLALLGGALSNMLSRYRSETEKISLRQLLGALAREDHLTGLANRLALTEAYERHMTEHTRDTVAIHCLDLDGFKQVNDCHGHPTGDALLKGVADRLRVIVRKSDIIARLGGDEFVVLQTGIADPSEAGLMANRVVGTLREPYIINGEQMSVGVSVGYALSSNAGEEMAGLLECADRALYQVKRQGGGGSADGADNKHENVVRLAS